MGELSTIAEVIQKYGRDALDAFLLAGVVFLYRQVRALEAARIADHAAFNKQFVELATKSIEADKDNTHAVDALKDIIQSRNHV